MGTIFAQYLGAMSRLTREQPGKSQSIYKIKWSYIGDEYGSGYDHICVKNLVGFIRQAVRLGKTARNAEHIRGLLKKCHERKIIISKNSCLELGLDHKE